jgi:large subunit ribosomal protein L4e
VWRRWHVKIAVNQRRYALVSALAASAVPALVSARGHRVQSVPEVPLVVDVKAFGAIDKTSKAVALLKSLGAYADVERVRDSRKIRRGKGKMRNRRYVARRGPLVIYNEKNAAVRAFKNVAGVEVVAVSRLNLLQLAPGGHLGRFCIWTSDAFSQLDSLYGTYRAPAQKKSGYRLPRPLMTTTDLARIINSDEVQSHLNAKKPQQKVHRHRRNPLTNLGFLVKLNPYAKTLRRRELVLSQQRQAARAAQVKAHREGKHSAAAKKARVASAKYQKANKRFHTVLHGATAAAAPAKAAAAAPAKA